MPLGLTQDHLAIADAAAALFAQAVGRAETRRSLEALSGGALPAAWQDLVTSGYMTVPLPELVGGGGGVPAQAAIVLEQAGQALVPGPFTSSTLAALLVAAGSDGDGRGHELVEGAPAACALTADGVTATPTHDGFRLDGSVGPVLDAPSARLLIIGAKDGDDDVWLVVDAHADGVAVKGLAPVDTTRSLGQISLTDVVVSEANVLKVSTARVRATAAMVFASEAAGTARWCLDTAVAYVGVREQFGKPVGSFQAVKHKLATLFMRVELMTAAAWDAARAVDQSEEQLQLAAASAALICLPGARDAALEAITAMGGIGFTWEHDISLYWRRATATAQLLGGFASWAVQLTSMLDDTLRDFSVDVDDEEPAFRSTVAHGLDRVVGLPEDERQRALADVGLVAPQYPTPYGLAATPLQQVIVGQEFRRRGMSQPTTVIGEFALPTVLAHGTDEQQRRLVMPTLRGDIIWCQLFSETGAGSDLASLRASATKVEGGWRLNGQKVWTSLGHQAHWGVCLARTDPDAPKHKGISYFLVDMTTEGIDVRPLRQSNGRDEFNEVFLDNVLVPDDCLVGEPGEGWRIATTTLANERLSLASNVGAPALARIRELASSVPLELGARMIAGKLAAEGMALSALNLRAMLQRLGGMQPGAATSVAKLATTDLRRAQMLALLDLEGPQAAAATGEDSDTSLELRAPVMGYLSLPSILIGGGTREIQLNVIAERVLGLPRG